MSARDTADIVNLLNLYGLAMDTQRWDLFDRIFTPDVDADFGGAAHWRDLASFKRDFAVYHDPFDSTQHSMTTHAVHLAGDTAHAFCNGNWRLIRRGMEGGDLWEGTGWYDDALVRTAVGWRIRHRICRVIYWNGNPLVNEPIPGVKFDLKSTVLRREAEAGQVAFVRAIGG